MVIGIVWIVLVRCEMLGVSASLGDLILDTRDRVTCAELMAMVLLIGLLGHGLDATRVLFDVFAALGRSLAQSGTAR